jgi:hypothetical protein
MKEIPNLNSGEGSLLKRLSRWLFSRRIIRRALVGFAGLVTLIAAFYALTDWRGNRRRSRMT